jgi:hypothetical protein
MALGTLRSNRKADWERVHLRDEGHATDAKWSSDHKRSPGASGAKSSSGFHSVSKSRRLEGSSAFCALEYLWKPACNLTRAKSKLSHGTRGNRSLDDARGSEVSASRG